MDTTVLENTLKNEIRDSNFTNEQKEDLERIFMKLVTGISDAVEIRDNTLIRDVC